MIVRVVSQLIASGYETWLVGNDNSTLYRTHLLKIKIYPILSYPILCDWGDSIIGLYVHLSLGTRPFARGRRKGSGHVPTLELCVVITVSPVTQYRVELSLPTSHVSQPDAITVSSKLGPTAVSKATKVCTEHADAHSLFWPCFVNVHASPCLHCSLVPRPLASCSVTVV